ncbi:hypothetical protein [Streptosporangium sp. NPDC048865]|uniref:hypothetical protein n=1 Tax=Streptosporangium sp. NPDC048865 TaxID=3155766 RepID=UPI003420F447
MADLRAKALGYLRSGAVTVIYANTFRDGPRRPYRLLADVVGYRSTYQVEFMADVWNCTCREDECAHIAAVALIAGQDTPARPTSRATASGRT